MDFTRNRELEAGFSDAMTVKEETKRDVEHSRERICKLEEETKEKSIVLSKITESIHSIDDRLSKSIQSLNDEENVTQGNSDSVLELVNETESKVEKLIESIEKKKTTELSRSVEFLEEENKYMNVLLRAALSEKRNAEKQLKESNEQKRYALVRIAEQGLQRIGFGFGFKEPLQESSEMRNLAKDKDEEEDEKEDGVVFVIEKTMKNLRQEISELKISLDESRLNEERLNKVTEEQARELEENAMYIKKLQNQETFLTHNVEELVKVISEAESEVCRWREACELEVEAGQHEVEQRDHIITVLKTEIAKKRSDLAISEGKLNLKEELAKAAMAAEEAAEKSLRLAERRITELLNRIERLYRQSEETESEERRRKKLRYVWCWPFWRLPNAASSAFVTSTTSSSSSSSHHVNNRALLRYDA
ncbi:unnamed protein product [Cochlearia groenlandica]